MIETIAQRNARLADTCPEYDATVSDINTQTLIRESRFPGALAPADCDFHIGVPGNPCKRCGSFHEFHVEQLEPKKRGKRGIT